MKVQRQERAPPQHYNFKIDLVTTVTGGIFFPHRYDPSPRWPLQAVVHSKAGRGCSELVQTHSRPCCCLNCRSESDTPRPRPGDDYALPPGLQLILVC